MTSPWAWSRKCKASHDTTAVVRRWTPTWTWHFGRDTANAAMVLRSPQSPSMQDGLAVAVVTMVMHGHKSLARYGAAGCAANVESEWTT
ncbi:hypothetical protein GQ55_6G289000 [Panicum hallii var. hallii]|uniref:Uncharacterized protein n=1 Tax=Panicum hallii var. hallii TaxID=1504633 RepID=A0A2T7DAT4_9POAL|nr:hypothetical protein GQ55_6G289000 [Panicum hallii var. hallii]